jgi:hypothetical protein
LFGFARTVGTPRFEAVLITLIFGLGASQLFSSMIVESYSYAALSLAVVWYITAQRIFRQRQLGLAAIATDVIVFGVTITNIAQAAIAELFAQWSQLNFGRALRNAAIAGAVAAVLSLLAIALTWPEAISYTIAHPVAAAKEIYWQQTYGPRTGLAQILLAFFGFSLSAPHFAEIALPEGVLMRDFRAFDMPTIAIFGMLLWNVLFLVSVLASFRSQRTRFMAGALLSAIIYNVMLHTRVQFRSSLFIYTPHLWFAVAALTALGAAAWEPSREWFRWYLRIGLVAVLVSVVPSNLARAIEATSLFDLPRQFLVVHGHM